MSMVNVDGLAVVVVVVGALLWLVSRFRSPPTPACHQSGAPPEVVAQVVLGASLQRGLQRARERKSEKRVSN